MLSLISTKRDNYNHMVVKTPTTQASQKFVLLVLVLMSSENLRMLSKHKHNPAILFYCTRRYGAENKAIIHSTSQITYPCVVRLHSCNAFACAYVLVKRRP